MISADAGKCPRCGYQLYAAPIPRHVRFHDLRGTAATLLLKAGVRLAVVQKILQHSDPKLTTESYGHLELEEVRLGLEHLDFGAAALPPAPPSEPAEEAQPARAMVANAEASTAPELRSNSSGESEAPGPSRVPERDQGPRLVGATGFEPATTCTPSKCATRLRYAPARLQPAAKGWTARRGERRNTRLRKRQLRTAGGATLPGRPCSAHF